MQLKRAAFYYFYDDFAVEGIYGEKNNTTTKKRRFIVARVGRLHFNNINDTSADTGDGHGNVNHSDRAIKIAVQYGLLTRHFLKGSLYTVFVRLHFHTLLVALTVPTESDLVRYVFLSDEKNCRQIILAS